jgi:hypothetical protein
MRLAVNTSRDRADTTEMLARLRELWCGWDPIGCPDSPNWPHDEYDSYLEPSLSLLQRGASMREVTEYLEWAAYRNMGLSLIGTPPATFAAQLVAWWEARLAGAQSAN